MKNFTLGKISKLALFNVALLVLFLGSSLSASEEVEIELTAKGKALETEYSRQLNKLRQELIAALPTFAQEKQAKDIAVQKKVDEEDRKRKSGPEFSADLSILDGDSEFDDDLSLPEPVKKNKPKEEKIAYEVILKAFADFSTAENELNRIMRSDPLKRAKRDIEWTEKGIARTAKGIEDVKKQLNAVKTDEHRRQVKELMASWQSKHDSALKQLEERKARLKDAEAGEAEYKKGVAAAGAKYKGAKSNLTAVSAKIGLTAVLNEDKLDTKLVKYVVLYTATSRGLAEFAEKSSANESLLRKMLDDDVLMKQMLIADGARTKRERRGPGPAQYGPAMKIYSDIQKASPKSKEGMFQRLAIAVALEHAIPIKQSNPKAVTDGPEFVDPVKRYQYYENAFLEGELDPLFKTLTVWEYRNVVNGDAPDETLTWGRETLRNFRPNLIKMDHEQWRYVSFVPSDVSYGSGDNKYDLPELQGYQNILMNGGVCGRRAFFGRFILRSFGIPVIARPSKGHAALARWTSKGWVVCLGPGWGAGRTATIYGSDRNFLASTQARLNTEQFLQVKRAQWVGDVFEEPRVYGEIENNEPKFWYSVSLKRQKAFIQDSKVEELQAIGENLGESDDNVVGNEKSAESSNAGKEITYAKDGSISIDAAAYSQNSHVGVTSTKSYHKGMQINLPRFGIDGQTLMRGGSLQGDSKDNSSGWRMKSGGYGRYDNWGFRVALTAKGDTPKDLTVEVADGVTMEFVYIKPGSFTMGGENNKDGRFECIELPKHGVKITKGYYLGKYEVTQAQFEAVLGFNTSISSEDPNCPADNVTWSETLKFCELVSKNSKREVRLPTEAEWEYAARAGSSTKWFFGDDPSTLEDYAWVKSNSGGKTNKVGLKKPNPWGLYDIYGNVVERVADIYDKSYYANSPTEDPQGPSQPLKTYFEYEVNAAQAGSYEFTANVVTSKHTQFLSVAVNDSKYTHLKLPFTVGEWQDSKPIKVSLKTGKNILRLKRIHAPQKGVAIKKFKLQPVK